jgi:hypothetical protein
MDEARDRLIDILLSEQLGGEHPPDLTERIVARAFPHRPFAYRRLLVAASVLLALGFTWWLWPRYPEPKASGDYELVSGDRVQRGAVLRTRDKTAALVLGGYSEVEIKPHTTLRIGGDKYAESISLEGGEVSCGVDRGKGTFSVQTALGGVSVAGTQFGVRLVEEKGAGGVAEKWVRVRVVEGTVLLTGAWGDIRLAGGEETTFQALGDRKPEPRGGTVIGSVTAKLEAWIDVKGDGEEKARRYVPRWVGGGGDGGLDKDMIRIIDRTPVGARVKLEWRFEERPRAVKLDVLQAPEADQRSQTTGILTAKGGTEFIEVRGEGDERPQRYLLHQGGTPELRQAIRETPVGSRVQIEWIFAERLRVIKLTPLNLPK